MDGNLGMGGSPAELRAFVEERAGVVTGVVVLCSSRENTIPALQPATCQAMVASHRESPKAFRRARS